MGCLSCSAVSLSSARHVPAKSAEAAERAARDEKFAGLDSELGRCCEEGACPAGRPTVRLPPSPKLGLGVDPRGVARSTSGPHATDDPVIRPATPGTATCPARVAIDPGGLWRDSDGDLAHEFWCEDRAGGELCRVPLSELVPA
mmetsp:Transcript_48140/g.153624  ORF Transcript_48140/g.153624 Transcript_48140/m.153624 type:complete len:144 (+) Transcript_48140:110-541(+)